MTKSLMWFKRDLRLGDNPALLKAVEAGDEGVILMYVLDPDVWQSFGIPQRAHLVESLRVLGESTGGLYIARGNPAKAIPRLVKQLGVTSVHAAASFGPRGHRRDTEVGEALEADGVAFTITGSPYAVAPGRVTKPDGDPYKVYTPFFRAWGEHGWREPAAKPSLESVILPDGGADLPSVETPKGLPLPEAGEQAALKRWKDFRRTAISDYDDQRNIPGVDGTSRMSVHLAFGEIHPRTLLADLGKSTGDHSYRREIAFREFYADVLWHRPDSVFGYYNRQFEAMKYDEPGDDLEQWKKGRTGFPIVDAGMRQLLAEGWMHNRVRMIVASFLVKDLHLEWQHGARHFLERLVDADIASNNHGWQWTAGCGTDASPYFRIFNPITQGKKFDPDGTYIRRYVPELADLDAKQIHEPWKVDGGPPGGYPQPLVDHAAEREESLSRYNALRGS